MAVVSAWKSHLDLRLHGRGTWITLAPLVYQSAVYGDTITVPAELITDLASVPRRPLAYMMLGGRCPAPAVLHDYLYQVPSWTDRELADAILYEAMAVSQPDLGFVQELAPIFQWTMWAGVRLGGWWAWRHDKARAKILNPVWTRAGWPGSP